MEGEVLLDETFIKAKAVLQKDARTCLSYNLSALQFQSSYKLYTSSSFTECVKRKLAIFLKSNILKCD
jgi:hypothetical protein